MAEVSVGLIARITKAIWNYVSAWVMLPFTLNKIEGKLAAQAISKEAKLCPNCDVRMKMDHKSTAWFWMFVCPSCNLKITEKKSEISRF